MVSITVRVRLEKKKTEEVRVNQEAAGRKGIPGSGKGGWKAWGVRLSAVRAMPS